MVDLLGSQPTDVEPVEVPFYVGEYVEVVDDTARAEYNWIGTVQRISRIYNHSGTLRFYLGDGVYYLYEEDIRRIKPKVDVKITLPSNLKNFSEFVKQGGKNGKTV